MAGAHDRIYNQKRSGDDDEDDEPDEAEQRLDETGCKEEHFAVLDCMGDNHRDWRRCQDVVKALKDCMTNHSKAA
eukprot:m.259217 g.259217  ORF g.259217 m.259217 type:complete len:75 (+) comp17585_c0_seq4:8353-8577(+)